jgi:hypothetical protein
MREIRNLLKLEDVALLKSLIGQEFLFVGGPEVPDFLVSDEFVLGASRTSLTISANMAQFAVENGIEEISRMDIASTASNLVNETEKSGQMFLSNHRSQITGVSLVRETATYNEPDELAWALVSDVSFVLHLLRGHVVLRKVSHSVEAISVTYSNKFLRTEIDKTSSRFAFSTTKVDVLELI